MSPSDEYKPPHGGRNNKLLVSSDVLVYLTLKAKEARKQLRRQMNSCGSGTIRANDRRIRPSGGGPC